MDLDKALDKVKVEVFKHPHAAFLSSILCSLDIQWDKNIPTAATNGIWIKWNPDWFSKLSHDARYTVLIHEIWHVARLHLLRGENKDHRIFNIACDYVINNSLERERHCFDGLENCIKDQSLDQPEIKSEEEIYDLLIKDAIEVPMIGTWGDEDGEGDLDTSGTEEEQAQAQREVLSTVVQATQQAKLSNTYGNLPGDLKDLIEGFLEPSVPWREVLAQFLTELVDDDYSWSKRNRRYPDVYLLGIVQTEGGLEHLMYFIDVSGSIEDGDIRRFNSEVKYIMDDLKPKKMTLVQFDTQIQKIDVFEEGHDFQGIHIIGRGGTDLTCVREMIQEEGPTAAIIFSDLWCAPMDKVDVPLIWTVVHNPDAQVSQGRVIHIKD